MLGKSLLIIEKKDDYTPRIWERMNRNLKIKIRIETVAKLKEAKLNSQKKLKTYDSVINYLFIIKGKYFKLKKEAEKWKKKQNSD